MSHLKNIQDEKKPSVYPYSFASVILLYIWELTYGYEFL